MKKITLFFTLLFAAFALAQTTLVQYQFEGTTTPAPGTFLNPDPGALGSPTITLVNPVNFNPVSAGNPGQSLSTVVDNKSSVRYIKLEITTADYNNITVSFDHWTNTNNGKPSWTVYANTTGDPYVATDRVGTANAVNNTWTRYNAVLGTKFNNSGSKITVYLVAANSTGNTSELRIDNLKISGCKILPPPAPAAPSPQIFCAGATVASLAATKSDDNHILNWYNSSTSNTPLALTDVLLNGIYYVSQTDPCGLSSPKTAVSVTVNPILSVSVTISATPGTVVCAGTPVTFTATPVNGGTAPAYQWQINGVNVPGATAAVFTPSSLTNANQVRVIMTSNASPCLTGSPATSNTVTMTVNPPVSAGTVSYTSNSVCIGGTATYSSNGTPGGTWSSSNTNVATVSNAGVVTGIAPGTATITYTINSGCGTPTSASADITVNPDVNAGTVSYSNNVVCVGSAVVYTSNGTPGGTWSSSNPAVAIVNSTGIVYGISEGTAIITYTLNSGCGTVMSASQQVTVTALPVATVSVTGSGQICSNTSAIFTITGTPGHIVVYTINNGPVEMMIVPASGSSQIAILNATTDQTLKIINVTNGSCTNSTPSSATITIGGTSTYSSAGWSNGLPSNNGLSAVIASDYDTANGSIAACSCTVNPGATLTVSPDTFVEVLTDVINNGNLIVMSDGNLKQINKVTNTTPVTVRRHHTLTEARKEYNFVSSPVAGQNMKMIYGNNAANVPFVTVLRESTNSFVNATSTDYGVVAKGFSVREPRLAYVDLSGDNLPVDVAQYKGVPNNGDISLIFPTYTTGRGYNLAGNPYPSNLDLIELYANSTTALIDPTFRFWDNSVNDIYTQMGGAYQGYSYALFNAATDTDGFGIAAPGNGTGPKGTKIPNRVIKVSQAFMVRATGAGAQLNYNNSMRRTSNTDTVFFGKSSDRNRYRLQLVKPDGLTIQNGIAYFEAGKTDFGKEDSRIPNSSASDALFSFAGDAKVVINGRSAFTTGDIVQLGLRHFTPGTYKIQAVDREGVFAGGQSVYLKDKQLGVIADLTEGDYVFSSEAGEFTNRFEIVYVKEQKLATAQSVKNGIEVYRDHSDFVVRSQTGILEYAELYDASGRLLHTVKGKSNEIRFNAESLLNGMYLLKAKAKDGDYFTKKIRK